MDSLDRFYKREPGVPRNVKAESWQDRETLTWPLVLAAGTQTLKVTYINHFWDEAGDDHGIMYLDRLVVLDDQGRRVNSVEFEDLEPPVKSDGSNCGRTRRNSATGLEDHFILRSTSHECAWHIDVEVPETGTYTVEVVAWSNGQDEAVWR